MSQSQSSSIQPPQSAPMLTVALVGIAAGFLSGMFGVGGGILIVPGLVLIAKMDQRIAHGTSLAAVLPISAASLVSYWSHDHVDFRVGLCLAARSYFTFCRTEFWRLPLLAFSWSRLYDYFFQSNRELVEC